MKSLLVLLTVLCSVFSQAGVLSNTMTDSVLESLLVDKGYAEIDNYDAKDFNLGKRISEVKESNEKINCEFKVTVSRILAINNMKKMADKEASNKMEALLKKGALKTAIVNQALANQNDTGNDQTSCRDVDLEIYSNDGEVLKINYDFAK